MANAFTKFEHEGRQRVAPKYDSVWASSTRQFIPSLLAAIQSAIEAAVARYRKGDGFSVPKAAYIIAIAK